MNNNGSPTSDGGSINYTGPHTSVKVDDYTVDLNCQDDCPIFPNTAFFLGFEAPEWTANTPEEDRAGISIGLGPYQLVEWKPGVSITQEAYADYVPVGRPLRVSEALYPECGMAVARGNPPSSPL